MDLGIAGKVALVTGGSRGLGRQAALALANEGVNVAICGRTKDTLDRTVEELRSTGVISQGFVADVSNVEEIHTLHNSVVSLLGPIDILVNYAGGATTRDDITQISL